MPIRLLMSVRCQWSSSLLLLLLLLLLLHSRVCNLSLWLLNDYCNRCFGFVPDPLWSYSSNKLLLFYTIRPIKVSMRCPKRRLASAAHFDCGTMGLVGLVALAIWIVEMIQSNL